MPLPTSTAGPAQREGQRKTVPVRSSSRPANIPAKVASESSHDRLESLSTTDRYRQSSKLAGESRNFFWNTPESVHDPEPYPTAYEDPDPVCVEMSAQEITAYNRALSVFAEKIFVVFSSENRWIEELWINFISKFHPHSVRSWLKGITYRWCKIFWTKGVHVKNGRETSRAEALVKIIFRNSHMRGLPNNVRTDRKEEEEIYPDLLERSVAEHQPATQIRDSISKTRTQPAASTEPNTSMDLRI